MKNTITVRIPIISKHHCCCDRKKYQPRKKWCKQWNKATNDCALECEPKPEWEKK